MKKYSVLVINLIYFTAVASFNVQTTVTDGSGSSVSQLPGPFQKIGENYYLIETNIKKTWYGAAHFCRTKGSHLASIDTEVEWQTLSSYLVSQGFTNSDYFWTAGNDIDTPFQFFLISSGQPMLYYKWSQGQPDNRNGVERCVHLWRIGDEFLMNDMPCNGQAYIICKAEISNILTITVW